MAKNLKDVQNKEGAGDGGLRAMSRDFFKSLHDGIANSIRRVTSSGLASDPNSSMQAKRVMDRTSRDAEDAKRSSYRGEQIQQAINVNAHHQTTLLQSIDSTLRKLSLDSAKLNITMMRDAALSRVRQIKSTASEYMSKTGKALGERAATVKKGVSDFADENFTIGNTFKYGAAIASTAYDTVQGYQNAQKWGVHPVIGALGGMMGGASGKGGMTNALKKAVDLGTLGGMIAGPMGALVGAVLGGVMGWIGGEKGAKFIQDLFDRIPSGTINVKTSIKEKMLKMGSIITSWWDSAENLFGQITDATTFAAVSLFAFLEENVGEILRKIGATMPGGAGKGLEMLGEKMVKNAKDSKSDAEQNYAQSEKKRNDEYTAKKEQRAKELETEKSKLNAVANESKSDFMGPPESLKMPPNAQSGVVKTAPETKAPETKAPETTTKKPDVQTKGVPELKPDTPSNGLPTLSGVPYSQAQPTKVKRATNEFVAQVQTTGKLGQIPMSEIEDATAQANARQPVIDGDFSQSLATPSIVASVLANESSGIIGTKAGDGGKSGGVTQMMDKSLADVNKTFGTTFTQKDIRGDYHQALLASALYQRVLMNRFNNDQQLAISHYNGSGPKARRYGERTMALASQLEQQPQIAVQTPAPKQQGVALNQKSVENVALNGASPSAPSAAPSVISTQQTNNTNQISLPPPSTRNDEPSLIRIEFGGYTFGA